MKIENNYLKFGRIDKMRTALYLLFGGLLSVSIVFAEETLTDDRQQLAEELSKVNPSTGPFVYAGNFERNGAQDKLVKMTGLDNTPNSRVWDIAFLTDLSTYRKGFRLLVR